jgi:ketosteroid isomerase-like protein
VSAFLVAMVWALASPSATADPPSHSADEAALREAKLVEWPGYYRRQDVDGLAAFLLPGFQAIAGDGAIEEREAVLASVRANPWDPANFRYEIDHIRFLSDDTALVIGRGGSDSARDGRPCRARYRSSNLFRKVEGRWRAALSHISGQACDPVRGPGQE